MVKGLRHDSIVPELRLGGLDGLRVFRSTPRSLGLVDGRLHGVLVPRPRPHLIRFHGVLAPNAKLRALVVPQEVLQAPKPAPQEAKPAECEANCAHHRPVRLSWAKLPKRVFDLDLEH